MITYSLNTNYEAVETVVAKLTKAGRETMEAVGKGELSFFDDGIVETSGIWGECLTGEMGHKSSGVVNRLRDLGLWNTDPADEMDSGMWWSLTALGADVANYLAGRLENQADAETQMSDDGVVPQPTVKVGRKWTTINAADGSLIAEVRNDQVEAVLALLAR